jgi:Glycosyltransferases involved in cell wall biogenesis
MKIDLSLIIITYNKQSRLRIMLESLKKIRFNSNFEILIIDNGSTDETRDLVFEFMKYCQCKKISCKYEEYLVKGRSNARNYGITTAQGEVVVFCDDDLILTPDFLEEHYRLHQGIDNLVVHGEIRTLSNQKFFANPLTGQLYHGEKLQKSLQNRLIRLSMFWDGTINDYLEKNYKLTKFETDIADLYRATKETDSFVRWIGFTGGNISVKRKNLINAGGFDVKLGKQWGCEDLEMGYRLFLNGMVFVYSAAARNYHIAHYSPERMKEHKVALEYCIKKHRQGMEFLRLSQYFDKNYEDLIQWYDAINHMRGI